MSSNNLFVFYVTVCVILFTLHAANAQKIFRADTKQNQRENIEKTNVPTTNQLSIISPDRFPVFPLEPGQSTRRVVVGDELRPNVESIDKLVYSNTLGIVIAQVPPHRLIADDLSLNAPAGCELSRFTFQVVGRANPDHIGGPYRVDYALYKYCPGTGGPVISGTQGFVEFTDGHDDVIQQVEIVIPADQSINLLPNIWLGLKTSRDNVGIIMGAPPLIGFSEDILDFPGFACNANIGGFPSFGHASFNTELYVRGQCPEAFTGYRNKKSYKAGVNHGANVLISSNIELGVDSCEMVGYEIGVRGPALYTIELRNDIDGIPGEPIVGTRKLFVHNENTFRPQSFYFDPPIYLDKNIWITIKIGNDIGGWVSTGFGATIGRTIDGAYHAMVTCAGKPPVGACCDMFIKECVGGHDKGKGCRSNDDCKHPGTCESVCREVPDMNCPNSLIKKEFLPDWIENATCDPDPFPFTCGAAACCRPDDICENLTRNECDDVEPVDDPRQWQIGKYCDEQLQKCPFIACLSRNGDCVVAHPEPGCERPICCQDVCEADPYCCQVEWDRQCVSDAALFCDRLPPANDECDDARDGHGALEVAATSSTLSYGINATRNESDPVYCCDIFSTVNQGFGTVWYKFVATHTSISIGTVSSELDEPALIQVYSVGDSSTNESSCNSLMPIACHDDDSIHVLVTDNFSKISLDQLTIGDTYYVEVAGKNRNDTYRLQIKSPLVSNHPANNFCNDADVITDGEIPYDIWNTSEDCLGINCPHADRDVWFDYTATCTGNLIITPCLRHLLPDTLTILDGCDCTNPEGTLFCGSTIGDDFCENVEPISIDVLQGHCYKIRLGVRLRSLREDTMLIECIQCDPGPVEWIDPPKNTVDARQPHLPKFCFDFRDEDHCTSSDINAFEIFNQFIVETPDILQERCWNVQESSINTDFHECYSRTFGENGIKSINKNVDGTSTLQLIRSITPSEETTIFYTDHFDQSQSATFKFLPGDVDGNLTVCIEDVRSMMHILEGNEQPLWGRYSADIDHSGAVKPADLLTLIDLMNGSGGYSVWLNISLNENQPGCP